MTRIVTILVLLVAWMRLAIAAPDLSYETTEGRITVRAEPGLERVANKLAASAETAMIRIAGDLTDLPVPRSIEVRLVRDSSDLPAVAPPGRGAPPWAIGVAYPY